MTVDIQLTCMLLWNDLTGVYYIEMAQHICYTKMNQLINVLQWNDSKDSFFTEVTESTDTFCYFSLGIMKCYGKK